MKQLCILLLFISSGLLAQDTIMTKSGQHIPAKVIEISSTEIKYKKSSMPDGPTYVQNRSDISMIIYANGQKDVFNDPVKNPEPVNTGGPAVVEKPKTEKPKPVADPNADYYGGGYTYAAGNQVTGTGSLFIYQNKRINEKQLHRMLTETGDKKVIMLVQKSKKMHKLQYIGFAAIPVGIISLVTMSTAYTYYPQTSSKAGQVQSVNNGQLATGAIIGLAAVACPVLSVKAKIDRKRYNKAAIKLYNEHF